MGMIRVLPVMAFFIVMNLYIGIHGFIFYRSIRWEIATHLPSRAFRMPGWIYWAVFIAAAAIYALVRYELSRRSLFALADAYWGMMLFFPLFLALDGIYLLRFVICHIVQWCGRASSLKLVSGFWGPSFTFVSHAIIILVVVSFVFYGLWRARTPIVTEYHITTEKSLPDGKLDVVLVSDIHFGALIDGEKLGPMVDKINSMEGDIVLIAGDILDREFEIWETENAGAEFSRLKAKFGVWAIPGNHDSYGGQMGRLKEGLAACGITLLEDEAAETGGFYVAGRRDLAIRRWGEERKPLKEIFEGFDMNRLIILMDHQPYDLWEGEEAGIDLQVSGHTHRGQIWPGAIITSKLYENHYGLSYRGKSAFIVSSGYGTWGPPIRVGAHPEIVRIVLRN